MTNEERAREAADDAIQLVVAGIEWGADPETERQNVAATILAALDAATAPLVAERERLREEVERIRAGRPTDLEVFVDRFHNDVQEICSALAEKEPG